MTAFLLAIATVVVMVMAAGFYRVFVGPTLFDRALAAAAVAATGVVLLVLAGFIYDRMEMFIEFAVAYALLNFVWPIALAKYFERAGEGDR